MANKTDQFQKPKQKFSTPDDLTTWATILRTKYWNDCLQNLLDNSVQCSPFKVKCFEELSNAKEQSSLCYEEMEIAQKLQCSEVNVFTKIRFFRQKPCLFGNSLQKSVASKNSAHQETCGVKRQASEQINYPPAKIAYCGS